MKRLILILMLFMSLASHGAMFSDFYVQTTGNNLFGGNSPDTAATYGTTGCNFTNDTSATLCTIYKSGLGVAATAVTNGAWCAVFPDGATTNGFIGRVMTNDSTQDIIQLSLVAKAGSPPASSTAGTSFNVGGAWSGPNTNQNPSCTFPFNFVTYTMTNGPGYIPRIWFKSGPYYTTNAMTHTLTGPVVWQGYGTTPGDSGKAIIDGTFAGAGYDLLTVSGGSQTFRNFIFNGNGATLTTKALLTIATAGYCIVDRCVFRNSRQNGLTANASCLVKESEAYDCNQGNASGGSGFFASVADVWFVRCYSHDNSQANSVGLTSSAANTVFDHCIAVSNKLDGFRFGYEAWMNGCEAYDNGGDGVDMTSTTRSFFYIENCNFLKNGGFGINSSAASGARMGFIRNCGFGSGTMVNALGDIAAIGGVLTNGNVIYAANARPWTDPENGNFSITLTAAKAVGNGSFNQELVNSPTNTVAYPDIGAAQSSSTNAASSEHSHVFAQ